MFLVLSIALTLFGSVNDVFSKLVANLYTQRFAFFVDQGNNRTYTLLSLIPVFCIGKSAWDGFVRYLNCGEVLVESDNATSMSNLALM